MRCIAIIEAERPGLDSVIIWETGDRIIAYAYENGKVTMTRPLDGTNMNAAINEVRERFQINDAQLTRVHNWAETPATKERIVATPRRWQ